MSENDSQFYTPIKLPEELRDRFVDPSVAFVPPHTLPCGKCGGVMGLEGDYDETEARFTNWYECGCGHYLSEDDALREWEQRHAKA